MQNKNKLILSLITILLFGGAIFWLTKDLSVVTEIPDQKTAPGGWVTYKSSEYSPEFTYPEFWGPIAIEPGSSMCPEEDTYRTQDTLSVFDQEFSWAARKLPGSESEIRMGIRTRELDPDNLNDCGDEFLLKIVTGEINPQTLSSVRLMPLTLPSGLWGIYNDRASRLDTEAREQYTFFMTDSLGRIHAIEAYASFIPYFGSKELQEIEGEFKNDIHIYVREGQTAVPLRENLNNFRKMVESLKWKGE